MMQKRGMARQHADNPDASVRERMGLPGYTADALYALAFNSLTAGQVRRAEKFFILLCMLEPEAAHGFLGYGICFAQRGDMQNAASLFMLASQINPHWAVPYFHLATARMAQNRHAEADEALTRFFERQDTAVPPQLRADAQRMRNYLDGQKKGS